MFIKDKVDPQQQWASTTVKNPFGTDDSRSPAAAASTVIALGAQNQSVREFEASEALGSMRRRFHREQCDTNFQPTLYGLLACLETLGVDLPPPPASSQPQSETVNASPIESLNSAFLMMPPQQLLHIANTSSSSSPDGEQNSVEHAGSV